MPFLFSVSFLLQEPTENQFTSSPEVKEGFLGFCKEEPFATEVVFVLLTIMAITVLIAMPCVCKDLYLHCKTKRATKKNRRAHALRKMIQEEMAHETGSTLRKGRPLSNDYGRRYPVDIVNTIPLSKVSNSVACKPDQQMISPLSSIYDDVDVKGCPEF